jgi:transposase
MIDQSSSHEKAQNMPYSDEKVAALSTARSLYPRPEAVVDPTFTSGDPFFDARDLVQVKYEMLRRVAVDGVTVRAAATAFGFSRPSFYAARAAWLRAGLPGLVPDRPGPRQGHKLTAEVLAFLQEQLARDAHLRPNTLVGLVHERFGVHLHQRSIERALVRLGKKVARRQP